MFNHWFDWIAATADGYVAISETIRDEVRAEMLRRIGPEKVAQRWFDYFHLGSSWTWWRTAPPSSPICCACSRPRRRYS